jgi:hypothetical protein
MLFKTDYLKAALTHAAIQDKRYYLNGVHIEYSAPSQTLYIVATDGHRIFVGRLDVGTMHDVGTHKSFAITVPAQTLKAVISLKTPLAALEQVPDSTKWTLGGMSFEPIGGCFPDWRRATRETELELPPTPCQVRGEYLLDAEKALDIWKKAAVNDKLIGHNMHQSEHACYLQHIACASAFVKIMPLNTRNAKPIALGIQQFKE